MILIVNDDGIYAEGIKELAMHLMADHKIVLCAPERNWSYSSHFMTLREPLSAKRVELEYLDGVECWAISGSPADCVSIAINKLLKKRPDAVISGINRGENLGVADLMSSGTYNSAACARRLGIPSAAISLARMTDDFATDYSYASRFSSQVVNALLSGKIPDNIVLNINVPGLEQSPNGVRITTVGRSTYQEVYTSIDTDMYNQQWIDDGSVELEEGSDVYWNERGFITVSPVELPRSDADTMQILLGFEFSI